MTSEKYDKQWRKDYEQWLYERIEEVERQIIACNKRYIRWLQRGKPEIAMEEIEFRTILEGVLTEWFDELKRFKGLQ